MKYNEIKQHIINQDIAKKEYLEKLYFKKCSLILPDKFPMLKEVCYENFDKWSYLFRDRELFCIYIDGTYDETKRILQQITKAKNLLNDVWEVWQENNFIKGLKK